MNTKVISPKLKIKRQYQDPYSWNYTSREFKNIIIEYCHTSGGVDIYEIYYKDRLLGSINANQMPDNTDFNYDKNIEKIYIKFMNKYKISKNKYGLLFK